MNQGLTISILLELLLYYLIATITPSSYCYYNLSLLLLHSCIAAFPTLFNFKILAFTQLKSIIVEE